MGHNKLLISEPPLQVIPSLAVTIGLNEAIILQQLHYWLENPKAGKVINGEKWIYNSYAEWHDNFPFWSESTIQRIFLNLLKLGVIISEQFNKQNYDRTNYYRIDYEKISELAISSTRAPQLEVIDDSNLRSLSTSETTTETTTHTLPVSSPPPPRVARTADDVRAMTLEALRSHAALVASGKSETQHFPPDVLQTVTRVCELWNLTPPRSKEARFSHWVKSAGELKHACGEYGISILDDVYAAWLESQYAVASPGSLINSVIAMVGKRRGEEPGGLAGMEDMTYYWNSELTPEENMRLMKEAQTKLPKQETIDDRPEESTQT